MTDAIALVLYEHAITLNHERVYFWTYRPRTRTTWAVMLSRYTMLVYLMLFFIPTGYSVRLTFTVEGFFLPPYTIADVGDIKV